MNGYMVKDKMPRELAARKKAVQNLQRIVAEPAMGQAELDQINEKVLVIDVSIG